MSEFKPLPCSLASDGRRIVYEEIAGTASCIVWISYRGSLWATLLRLSMVRISAVTDMALVIRATPLPADGAWAASSSYTALVAISAKMTAG